MQDPGGISQHLLHGPVRDAVAVRETASPIRRRRVGLGREFPEQPALPDSRRSEQRQKHRPARGAHLPPAFAQDGNLVLSADERRARGLPPRSHVPRRDRLPCSDGQRLSLHLLRIERLVVDHVRGRAVRGLAHDDAVRRRGGLQARGGVDDVTCDHGLALARPRAEYDERLARIDTHADAQAEIGIRRVHGRHGCLDREGRSHRALGIILMRNGCAEDGHDRVADELLYGPAEALKLPSKLRVVRIEHPAHGLGIELLRLRREADQVGEEDRDDLALLAARSGGGERRSTGMAEAGLLGIRLTACPAGFHGSESRSGHERNLSVRRPGERPPAISGR